MVVSSKAILVAARVRSASFLMRRPKTEFLSRGFNTKNANGYVATMMQQKQQSNRDFLCYIVGGSAALLSALMIVFPDADDDTFKEHQTNYPSTVARCEQQQPPATCATTFQVVNALESKDEVQRVRLAQILHDLHELAAAQKEQRNGPLRRLWKLLRHRDKDPQTAATHATAPPPPSMPPTELDYANLTPQQAEDLIRKLIHKGQRLNPECLLSVLDAVTNVLQQEETLLDLRPHHSENVAIVGDLHGSLSSLQYVLQAVGEIHQNNMVIFNGDFVDRGNHSLEVMLTLILLKIAHPNHVFLLRGNHEDVLVAAAYGFHDEVIQKYGSTYGEQIWEGFAKVFGAIPIGALTENAVMLHGGLPGKDFHLDQLRAILSPERCKLTSLVQPPTEAGRLIQSVVWSDPSNDPGVSANDTRTVGIFYGPDVAKDFLKRHNLQYLIRAHEVALLGTNYMSCGKDMGVITVFSQSEYPNSCGNNMGAFVNLHRSGEYEVVRFSKDTKLRAAAAVNRGKLNPDDPYVGTVKALISAGKHALHTEFDRIAPHGEISLTKWAEVMGKVLDLTDLPWLEMLPSLVPEINDAGEHESIHWGDFLQLYSQEGNSGKSHGNVSTEILRAHDKMLTTVFRFLDVDRSGSIDLNEFKTGIELLNKRLPADRKQNAASLFQRFDVDGNGEISLEEFQKAFKIL